MLAFILANSADPDDIPQTVTVHVGFHCLPIYSFRVFLNTNVLILIVDAWSCILLSTNSWICIGTSDVNVSLIAGYFIYNQATTKLAFHSNETSKDKLSII